MVMVLVDYLMGIPSPKLDVPDRFEVRPQDWGSALEVSRCFSERLPSDLLSVVWNASGPIMMF